MRIIKTARLLLRRGRKSMASTRSAYEAAWATSNAVFFDAARSVSKRFWTDRSPTLGTGLQYYANHLDVVNAALANVRRRFGGTPRALEIGCGRGINLAWLAAQNPDCRFVGAELSLAGSVQSRRWSTLDDPEWWIWTCGSSDPATVAEARRRMERVSVVQTNCRPLPFASASVDFVFSRAALEQMIDGYREVLDEIVRVLRPGGIFVAIEPFREFQTPRQYFRLWLHNYFRAPVAAITAAGLRILNVKSDILTPAKMRFTAVVAQKPE